MRKIAILLLAVSTAWTVTTVASAQCVPTTPLDAVGIQSFGFTADDQHLILYLKDNGGAGLWDPATGKRVFTFPGATGAFRRGETHVTVYTASGGELWSNSPPTKLSEVPRSALGWRQGRYSVTYTDYNQPDRKVVTFPEGEERAHFKDKRGVLVSEKGGWALNYGESTSTRRGLNRIGEQRDLSGMSAKAVLWDLEKKKQIAEIEHEPVIDKAVAAPDGKTFATQANPVIAGYDKNDEITVKLWDAATGRELGSYQGFRDPNFTTDGKFLVMETSSSDPSAAYRLAVVAINRPHEVMRSPSHHPPFSSAMLPDGRLMAAQKPRGLSLISPGLDVIDPASMRVTFTLPGHYSYSAPNQSEDGRFLVARRESGDSKEIELYSLPAFQKVCSFAFPKDWEPSVGLSATGRYIVLSKWDSKGTRVELYERFDPTVQAQRVAAMRKQSQALTPQDKARAEAMFKQAFELFQAGEFEAAALGFQKGLEIDPANGLGHYYLAETYTRQNKMALARQHYQRTVDFAPDSKEALLAQTRLGK